MKVLFYLIFLFIGFSFATEKAPTSKWTPEIGISIGSPAPLFLSVGLHYQFLNKVGAFIRTEGLGSHTRKNDYWCGARGAIGFSLFRDQPFFLESGVSVGYFYARAPNRIQQIFNEINQGYYFYEYDWNEFYDISINVGIHLYGVHVRTELPLFSGGNTSYSLLWRVGYLWSF
jgi:hypothetical protein